MEDVILMLDDKALKVCCRYLPSFLSYSKTEMGKIGPPPPGGVPLNISRMFSLVQEMEKRPLLQFVPRARYAPLRPSFAKLRSSDTSPSWYENFSPLLTVVQDQDRPL